MATLKISDLSVGDWLRIDQAELNMPSDDLATAYIEKLLKPIRIKGISEDSDMVIADIEIVAEWGSIMMKCEYLRPIPITEEILEKNGFVKNGEYDEWNIGNWNDIPFIGISLSRQSMRIKNLRTDIFLENKVVYVHQLQCALRLAGVDKKINL